MRSRRIRSRFSRPMPKPELIIGGTPAPREIPVGAVEPSRAREREPYTASAEDNATVKRVVEELLVAAGVGYEAEFEHDDFQRVYVRVDDGDAGSLIGKRGAGLEALETLVGRMVSHQAGRAVPVQVDVNEYRARYEEGLRTEALALAERVLRSGQDEHLPPMSARDRRVVHLAIQEMKGLQTLSLGHGPTKHVVIHGTQEN